MINLVSNLAIPEINPAAFALITPLLELSFETNFRVV